MKPVPHGEPYAGKLHVRFDEGAGVPHGASRSTLHPFELRQTDVAKAGVQAGMRCCINTTVSISPFELPRRGDMWINYMPVWGSSNKLKAWRVESRKFPRFCFVAASHLV